MMIQVRAPLAPVISHLRPLMTYLVAVADAPSVVELARVRAGAVGLGHREHRTLVALDHRRQELLGLRSLAILASRNMLPSSGAAQFSATGPSVDQPAASKSTACSTWRGSRPPSRWGLESQQPGLAGQRDQLVAQVLGRAVRGDPRVRLERHDLLGDERADLVAQRGQVSAGISKSIMVPLQHQFCWISAWARSNSRRVVACSRSPISVGA